MLDLPAQCRLDRRESGGDMVRGILYYLLVWAAVSVGMYLFNRLSRGGRVTVIRCVVYGLATATVALGLVLLIVALF